MARKATKKRIKLTTKETSWSQTEMFPTLNICEESLTSGQARPTHTRHITNSSGQQISHEKNCLLGACPPCAFLKTFRKLKLAGPLKLSILQPLMLDVGVGQKLQDLYCAQTIHIAHSGVHKGKGLDPRPGQNLNENQGRTLNQSAYQPSNPRCMSKFFFLTSFHGSLFNQI